VPAPDQRPIAAVDIGSNSVFLFVAVSRTDGSLRVVETSKSRARLAAHTDAGGALLSSAIDTCVETLGSFRERIEKLDAEPIFAATAAVRGATNRAEFVAAARERAGVDVRIFSGEQEARTMFRGVRIGRIHLDGDMLCVDVGGGSTELAFGSSDRPVHVASVPLGAVSLSVADLLELPVSTPTLSACRTKIRAVLQPVLQPFSATSPTAISTSGSAQRIARIVAAIDGRPFGNGMTITTSRWQEVVERMVVCRTLAERRAIPGMDSKRADVLLGGALVYAELADLLGLSAWKLSTPGLRSGLVAGIIDRRRGIQPPWIA